LDSKPPKRRPTTKQRKLVEAVANGANLVKAYETAYDTSMTSPKAKSENAKDELGKPHVSELLVEATQIANAALGLTLERYIAFQTALAEDARAKGDNAVASACMERAAKGAGLLVERQSIQVSRVSVADMLAEHSRTLIEMGEYVPQIGHTPKDDKAK
jgi:hypothetical protein